MNSTSQRHVTILGIDPGIAKLGYGCIQRSGGALIYKTSGVLTSPATTAPEKRLAKLWTELSLLYEQTKPDHIVVEKLFPAANVTLHRVSEVRGIILLLAGLENTPIEEVSPRALKAITTRFGGASKTQMRRTVQKLLNMPATPPADAADALALAILGSANSLNQHDLGIAER